MTSTTARAVYRLAEAITLCEHTRIEARPEPEQQATYAHLHDCLKRLQRALNQEPFTDTPRAPIIDQERIDLNPRTRNCGDDIQY